MKKRSRASSARLREPGVGKEVGDGLTASLPPLRLAGMHRGPEAPVPQSPMGKSQAGLGRVFLPVGAAGGRGAAVRGASPAPGRARQSGGTYVTYVTLCKERLLPSLSHGRAAIEDRKLSFLALESVTSNGNLRLLRPGTSRVVIMRCCYKISGFIGKNIPYAGALCGDILLKIGVRRR